MKQHLAFLLLCVVLSVKGEGSNKTVSDHCHHGLTVLQTFDDFRCRRDDFLEDFLNSTDIGNGPLTVDQIQTFVTGYCSVVMPAIRSCFAENMSDCEPSQRDFLNQKAEETAFLCEPYTHQVRPEVKYVLARLRNDDIQGYEHCARIQGVSDTCNQEAEASIGVHSPKDFPIITEASVQDLVVLVNTFFPTEFECTIRMYRENPNRCRQWRMQAMEAGVLENIYKFTPYGLHLGFNYTQLARMFEVEDRDGPPFGEE